MDARVVDPPNGVDNNGARRFTSKGVVAVDAAEFKNNGSSS